MGSFDEMGDTLRERRRMMPHERIRHAYEYVKPSQVIERQNTVAILKSSTELQDETMSLFRSRSEVFGDNEEDSKKKKSGTIAGNANTTDMDGGTVKEEANGALSDILVETIVSDTVPHGVTQLLQSAGVGAMRPNMLIMPLLLNSSFKDKTKERDGITAGDYVEIIGNALRLRYGAGLIYAPNWTTNWASRFVGGKTTGGKEPIIDVYWLADTGGAILLIGYIHSIWKAWNRKCRLRVFLHSSASMNAQTAAQVLHMIHKFRIPVWSVEPFDMYKKPSVAALAKYTDKMADRSSNYASKLKRYLRVGEVVQKKSVSDATFVYVTLPFPAVPEKLTAEEYLVWLEAVVGAGEGKGRPPICFLRGNQKNVLTFYS